jgi:flagellar protein FlgJ
MNIQDVPGAHSGVATTDADGPRIKAAAHEFEASLMKEFLKPLGHDSLFSDEKQPEGDDEGGSAGAIMSFGSQAMATALSERGGFGIATMIVNHFHSNSPMAHSAVNSDHRLSPFAPGAPGPKAPRLSADKRT